MYGRGGQPAFHWDHLENLLETRDRPASKQITTSYFLHCNGLQYLPYITNIVSSVFKFELTKKPNKEGKNKD